MLRMCPNPGQPQVAIGVEAIYRFKLGLRPSRGSLADSHLRVDIRQALACRPAKPRGAPARLLILALYRSPILAGYLHHQPRTPSRWRPQTIWVRSLDRMDQRRRGPLSSGRLRCKDRQSHWPRTRAAKRPRSRRFQGARSQYVAARYAQANRIAGLEPRYFQATRRSTAPDSYRSVCRRPIKRRRALTRRERASLIAAR